MIRAHKLLSGRIRTFAVTVLIAITVTGVCQCDRLRREEHHVVVFLLDTVRLDALGCYGNPTNSTPNVDALAADGVRFDQAISTSGWTLPAVASLLTGTWPTIHGATGYVTRLRPIRPEVPTAPEILQERGFTTLGFANAAFVSPMVGIDRGFDHFDHRYTYNWDARRADETIDAALSSLEEGVGRRSFIMIHLFDPHLDYDPPGEYATKHTNGRSEPEPPLTMAACKELMKGDDPPADDDVAYVSGVYQGEVDFMDAQIGRFIEALKARGMYDATTIVVTADHGEEFWEHGGFEHGHTLYDELVRVPLIIKFQAGVAPEQKVVPAQVRFVDILPTVFELVDAAKPATFEGRSLMPLVRGENDATRPALCEGTLYGERYLALREDPYKYVALIGPDESWQGELYNWREDPGEQHDLAATAPQVAAQMEERLRNVSAELGRRARHMSQPDFVDMSPVRIKQLRSLGYIR